MSKFPEWMKDKSYASTKLIDNTCKSERYGEIESPAPVYTETSFISYRDKAQSYELSHRLIKGK